MGCGFIAKAFADEDEEKKPKITTTKKDIGEGL